MSNFRGVTEASVGAIPCYNLSYDAASIGAQLEDIKKLQLIDFTREWCPGPDLNRHARLHEAQDFKSCDVSILKSSTLMTKSKILDFKKRQKSISRRRMLSLSGASNLNFKHSKFSTLNATRGKLMEHIEVTIRKFEGLVKRKDIKSPQWFAMPNDVLVHPDFFDITGDEFKAFTWICGIASKLNSATIRVYPDVCARQILIPAEAVAATIKKLNGKRWDVTPPERGCHATGQDSTGQDSTGQDSTGQDSTEEEEAHASPPRTSFKNNKYFLRLQPETKEALIGLYKPEFLSATLIEITGYLDGKGYRFQNSIDSFIPRSLRKTFLREQKEISSTKETSESRFKALEDWSNQGGEQS